ncbi:hypothetical protein BKI52_11155 [marine bacterium AO1-C]|nr:hypothetical protein BKI52_11155 [marine bacterium AO1-C]
MKRIALSFLIACSVTLSYAQSPKDNLKKDFNNYIGLSIKKDFEKSMDYIVEDFFDIVPKDQMVAQFERAFNDPGLEIKLEDPKILKISALEKIDKKHYAIIKYSNILKMKVLPQGKDETEKDLKQKAELIKAAFAKQPGIESLKYDEKNHSFEAKVIEKVCGVSNDEGKQWKFVKLDKSAFFILEKFIPKEILERKF